jgi:pSer/pThr/pTyr-binding forkhead associated (FHA) protein
MLQVKIDIKSEEINNTNTVISSLLSLEVLFGEEKRRKITFDSRKNKIILIGRIKSECDFCFEDPDVSRKQCMITFDDNNWYLVDGNGENPSSNGTWFYPEKFSNITDGTIIRIGTTLFECNYIQDP